MNSKPNQAWSGLIEKYKKKRHALRRSIIRRCCGTSVLDDLGGRCSSRAEEEEEGQHSQAGAGFIKSTSFHLHLLPSPVGADHSTESLGMARGPGSSMMVTLFRGAVLLGILLLAISGSSTVQQTASLVVSPVRLHYPKFGFQIMFEFQSR